MTHKFVLYADDDVDDKDWVAEACKAIDCTLNIVFVDNGRQVLEYLNAHINEVLPALIVLDLNMPELDGRQALQRIKEHGDFKNIPVVVVTTSVNKMDRDTCMKLGASLYLTKPNTHRHWQEIIRQLVPFVEK